VAKGQVSGSLAIAPESSDMFDITPFMRLYGRWRRRQLARQDAVATQERQLLRLIRRAQDTRFGRDHGFADIGTVAAFQERVPLHRYEDFWEGYWKDSFPDLAGASWPETIPYFAKTSGTSSGASKFIPVSKEIVGGNRRSILDMIACHLAARPGSKVLGGRSFMLGGAAELEQLAPGIQAGDMSGIAAGEVPRWAQPFYFPPADLARIADWEEKLRVLGPRSLQADIRILGGTTSWLLLFIQDLAKQEGKDLAALYPALELIVYGGVGFAPYRAAFEAMVAGTEIDLREVYPASEGFIAYADRGIGEGLRLTTDIGLFYEFVPADRLGEEQPPRHWLDTAEVGQNYALVLSSPAGLFSYILGDTVRFLSLDPPRILITGRTSTSLSAFGEHLVQEEIDLAIGSAAEAIGTKVQDYAVGAVYPNAERSTGQHRYVVEFAGEKPESAKIRRFTQVLDETLMRDNDDYRGHREGDIQMLGPEVLAAAPGTFYRWMKARGRLGGQNKVPRVLHDAEQLADLAAEAEKDPA